MCVWSAVVFPRLNSFSTSTHLRVFGIMEMQCPWNHTWHEQRSENKWVKTNECPSKTFCHTWSMYADTEGDYVSLDSDYERVVRTTPRPLYSRERYPVPIVQEAGLAPRPDWTSTENLPPTGIDPRTTQSVAQSLYRLHYLAHSLVHVANFVCVRKEANNKCCLLHVCPSSNWQIFVKFIWTCFTKIGPKLKFV
jgi:hypothetical protein